ncbi:MAG: hypothetical protein R3213_11965 [Flavobacteriaceae bacterium]|nr:hypothetical protein [Flavobacteriaceae bacterium]
MPGGIDGSSVIWKCECGDRKHKHIPTDIEEFYNSLPANGSQEHYIEFAPIAFKLESKWARELEKQGLVSIFSYEGYDTERWRVRALTPQEVVKARLAKRKYPWYSKIWKSFKKY